MKKLLLTLIVVGAAFVLVACSGQGEEPAAAEIGNQETSAAIPASQDQIVNIIWQWSDLTETEPAGQSVVPNSENYTLTLLADGKANVKADCNSINWSYTMDGNKITFNTLFATTLVACGPDSMDQAFLQNLGKAESAELMDGRLILNLNDGGKMGFVNGGTPTATVSGTITTAEPAALPDDAVIQIQIQNSSLADAPAEVLGEQVLEAAGAQFPVHYKVNYNPAGVDDRFSYSMSVRVTDASGKLLFISDTVTPVITNGQPTSDVNINVVPVGLPEVGAPEVAQPALTITTPQPGETLDGPYVATGTGVGLPEGNVVVRLLDGNGEEMAVQTTVLQGDEVGTGGPGTWQVQFDNIYGQPQSNGAIEASNPETGASASVSIWFSGK